jgi:hypothetical protein
MSNEVQTTSLDEIDDIVTRPEVGRYRGKLLQVTGEISSGKNPMITPIYVITEGNFEGAETRQWLTLFKKKSKKNQKTYAFGPMEIKRIFALVGKPLPAGFKFPMIDADDPNVDENDKQKVADAAASLFAKRLANLDLEIVISDDGESDKIDERTGKPYRRTRTSIAGLFKKAAPVVAADVKDPYDDDEDE